MANEASVQKVYRLPAELLRKMDAVQDKMKDRIPGVKLSHTDVARFLLEMGLRYVDEHPEVLTQTSTSP